LAITITRRQALRLRSVFRRAFGTRGPGPAVCFTAGVGTLSVKARFGDMAVEYTEPRDGTAETLWLPFQALGDFEGKKDEPVHIEPTGNGHVTVQWRDRGVPQLVRYDSVEPPDAGKFPSSPADFAENPPGLLKALVDAGDTTDPDSTRYALACIQLCAEGSVGATDGRQLLVQGGFTFPWQEAVLIPRSKFATSAELPRDQPVLVGKTGDWVAFRVGPWTFYMAINKEGRFPDLSRQIPRLTEATARCQLSPTDAEFLAQTLPSLPTDDVYNHPVTVELNGSIAVRARAADQPKPTEILLTSSTWSGESIRLHTNRKYLARAAKLGFRELLVYGNKVPVLCHDENRQYVWALLDPESAIVPAEDAIRILSSGANSEAPVTQPRTRRRVSPVPEPATNPNGSAASNGNGQTNGHATKTNGQARRNTPKVRQQDLAGLIQQAETLRTVLRETLVKTNELLKGLKRHRRQSRALESTIASLRQLKGLGV
jgi:hypothetical protein